MSSKTTFIGAGNIAQAIMGGYAKSSDTLITAADPMQAQLDKLPAGIQTTTDNLAAIAEADAVVLCVKPNMMATLCQTLASDSAGKLFISVAAGITLDSIGGWLGPDARVIRCMPNTPALVQEGMTGLYAGPGVTDADRVLAETVLGSVGRVQWFDEEIALDAVTAISGSGPAYFFLVMEAMQEAGQSLGLPADVVEQLVLQTAYGASKMARESDLPASQLRINVTSPGGTTEAALNELNEADLKGAFAKALLAAFKKSGELSAA